MICIVRHYVLVYVLRSYLPNLIKREKESNQHTVLCQHTHLRLEGTVYLVGVGQYKAKHGGFGYPHAEMPHTQKPNVVWLPSHAFFCTCIRLASAHTRTLLCHTTYKVRPSLKLLPYCTRNESYFSLLSQLILGHSFIHSFIHFISSFSQSRLARSYLFFCFLGAPVLNLSKFDATVCVGRQVRRAVFVMRKDSNSGPTEI
jgi:hypothetical protein